MSGAADTAAADGGETLAAIIAAAVDAFLREESDAAARTESARRRGAISAWRMAARTASGFGARGYGAGAGWRGVD